MAIDPKRAEMKADRCILLICDIQEKFNMFKFGQIIHNSSKLINMLEILKVPMILTESDLYGNLYGSTIPTIYTDDMDYCIKGQFTMCTEEILQKIEFYNEKSTDKSILFHVILIGVETHIYIEGTAIDLRKRGYEVDIVADCCTSRIQDNRLLAFQRMRDIGCQITTTESIVQKLLGGPDHAKYSSIMPFIDNPNESTSVFPLINHL